MPADDFEAMKAEVAALRAAVAKLTEANPPPPTTVPASMVDLELMRAQLVAFQKQLLAMEQEVQEAKVDRHYAERRAELLAELKEEISSDIDSLMPGFTNFVISGAAVAAYQDRGAGSDSTFGVGVAPTFIWKPTERLLFETEIAFGLADEDTEVELDYAQISYVLNDYLTVGVGKFLIPFGTFWERWHPSWINRTPTMPLVYERGLIGSTGLGVQLRGGAPIGPTKINYAAYVINGPDFKTSFASAGQLGFGNNRDNNNNKAYGGRFGFLPIPELELGVSFLAGRVGDTGSDHARVDTTALGADLSYAREFEAIKGRIDLRAEYVFVDTDDTIFTGLFDPFTFDNKRNGWFVQAAYRPTLVDGKLGDKIDLKNFEFALRYDQLRQPGPERLGVDRDQITFSIDYWIMPNAVVKLGYLFDDAHGGDDQDGILLQMAIGF